MTELTAKFQPPAAKDLFRQEQLDAWVVEGVSRNDERLLGLALLSGGSPDAAVKENSIPVLHIAASLNKVPHIRTLASFGAKIDAEDKYGSTALFEATYVEAHWAMGDLLRLKANVNHQNKQLYTVLMYAVDNADLKAAEIILAARPDTSLRNEKGQTALEMARKAAADPNRFTDEAKGFIRSIIAQIEEYDASAGPQKKPPAPPAAPPR